LIKLNESLDGKVKSFENGIKARKNTTVNAEIRLKEEVNGG
jgi:hypothetical protein